MIQKKTIPWWIFAISFVIIMSLSYLAGGIFSFSDVTIINFMDKFVLVLQEFYKPWKWANAKTPMCLELGLVLWVFVCWYLTYHFRNFHTGKEHGDEEWADVYDVTKRRGNPDKLKNRILSYNVRMAKSGSMAPSNNNMLVIGSSGSYKTTSIVTPNILQATDNYIVLDVKGELMFKYGLYLKSKGYTIRCLNLKNQEYSDRYNPFEYIENEEDLIKLIANIQDSLTPPDAMQGDPFWNDGVALYLQAVFYYEWYMARKEGRVGTFNNVLKLVNLESQVDTTVEVKKGEKPPTLLQKLMNELAKEDGVDNPAVRDYRKLKEGAAETVRSIIIITNAKLKLCETKGLKRIFEKDDIHLREFATGVGGTVKKPTANKLALFLCVDDNDTSYNFICSMLYTQALTILSRMADEDFKDKGGALPIPLEMWLDEFYAGARPTNTERIMGVVRSRNISLIPILQSVAQVKALFKTDKWEIIMDNCPTLVFLGAGAGALETHKYISELLGKMTIDTVSDGKNGNNYTGNFNRAGRELMTPNEVKRMDRKYCIIFTESERPIYDYKALPWELPGDKVRSEHPWYKFWKRWVYTKSTFEEAMDYNKDSVDGGYTVEKRCVIDPHTGAYETVDIQKRAKNVTEDEVKAVAEDKKTVVIDINSDEFLGMNLDEIMKSKGLNVRSSKETEAKADEVVKETYQAYYKTKKRMNAAKKSNSDTQDADGLAILIRDSIANEFDKMGQDKKDEILQALRNGEDEAKVVGMFG